MLLKTTKKQDKSDPKSIEEKKQLWSEKKFIRLKWIKKQRINKTVISTKNRWFDKPYPNQPKERENPDKQY